MKIMHLSDLHLGRRIDNFSMLEDQKDILQKILCILDDETPDVLVIAGDVYDKSSPAAEAVQLFDDFLYELAERQVQVFILSGNHDSPERIAFGARWMEHGIHMSPVYDGNVLPFSMEDAYGTVQIYMLPFLKPANVRQCFPEKEDEIISYTDALRTAVDALQISQEHRNVLITHQFITGASRSESEYISVGGTDNVDASVFDGFDYVALGHIHSPQNVGDERIRYCGTPLKYSFSEADDKKSVTIVELAEKGNLQVRTIPLIPLHDMVKIKGTYMELTERSFYENLNREYYFQITLTDEETIPDAIGKLRVIYQNLMKIKYDNQRTRTNVHIEEGGKAYDRTPIDLFSEFYELNNHHPMSEKQQQFVEKLIQRIWEEKK